MKYIVIMAVWAVTLALTYSYGYEAGVNSENTRQVEIKQAIADTREMARLGAADEIVKIKVTATTIQGKLTTIIRENPVYRDCSHDANSVQLINSALTGK